MKVNKIINKNVIGLMKIHEMIDYMESTGRISSVRAAQSRKRIQDMIERGGNITAGFGDMDTFYDHIIGWHISIDYSICGNSSEWKEYSNIFDAKE